MINTFFHTRLTRDCGKTALVEWDTQVSYTYGELAARAHRLACFLSETCGVAFGDRVAIFSRNNVCYLDVLYAMPSLGAIMTSYNHMLKIQELEEMFTQEAPKVFLYEPHFIKKVEYLQTLLPTCMFIPLDHQNQPEGMSHDPAVVRETWLEPVAHPDISLESTLMLLHTGGTTGVPKAAKISYRSIINNTLAQIVTFGITHTDKAYISYPLFHGGGWNYTVMLLTAGGEIVYKNKFSVEDTWKMIETARLTLLAGSPSVFRRMQEDEKFAEVDFSSVRMIRCGGAPPSRDLVECYEKKGLLFYNGYGTTEVGFGVLSLPAGAMTSEERLQKAGAVGKAMLFSEVRLVDSDGNDVACGQRGEIIIRGGLMFSGYWKNEEETMRSLRDGWFYTGDIGEKDHDGFYYICGRKKNMFISGGENIYPPEIENVILGHPDVRDACVIGVADQDWGEVGKAIVVRKETLDEGMLLAYMRQHLSTIRVPKYIQFVDELPRNEAGKLVNQEVITRYSI